MVAENPRFPAPKQPANMEATCRLCAIQGKRYCECEYNTKDIITIQRTSKNIKAHILVSLFIMVIGFMMAGAGGLLGIVGFMTGVCGVIWFISAKIARWWNHD